MKTKTGNHQPFTSSCETPHIKHAPLKSRGTTSKDPHRSKEVSGYRLVNCQWDLDKIWIKWIFISYICLNSLLLILFIYVYTEIYQVIVKSQKIKQKICALLLEDLIMDLYVTNYLYF